MIGGVGNVLFGTFRAADVYICLQVAALSGSIQNEPHQNTVIFLFILPFNPQ